MTRNLDQDTVTRLRAKLDAQRGRVTWQQLEALGLDQHDLDHLSRTGLITRVVPGLWRTAGAPDDFLGQVMSAVLACDAVAAAARTTALKVHGVIERAPATIEVVVGHGHRPRPPLPGVSVRRSRTLTDDQIVSVDGVPATIVERALVDSAITSGTPRLRELVAKALRGGFVQLHDVSAQLEVSGRIHGARRMAAALLQLDPDVAASESRAEQVAFEALVRAGLPTPVRQFAVALPDGMIRIDLAYPDLRLAIEIDGFWWHSTPQRKAADERRQNQLVQAGWRVLRFGAGRVVSDPAHLVAEVARAVLASA